MTALRSGRGPDCVSELLLDRLLAGEVTDTERADAERHVAGCASCATRRQEREQQRAQFRATAPPLRRPASTTPPAPAPVASLEQRRSRRARPSALVWGTLAVAAGVALVPLGQWVLDSGEETMVKGNAIAVRVFVRHDGAVRPYSAGDSVQSGDALAFALDTATTANTHIVVVGRDARGKTAVYYPDGATATRAVVTEDGALPFSVVLDDAPGPETFHVFACAAPVPVAVAVAAVDTAAPHPPISCARGAVSVQKRPR